MLNATLYRSSSQEVNAPEYERSIPERRDDPESFQLDSTGQPRRSCSQ